jgi:peroxiredoxin family protein
VGSEPDPASAAMLAAPVTVSAPAEFIEMIADTGAGLYGCQASCDLFGLSKDDLIYQVTGIITVGEFYALAAGGQIIFT